MPKIKPHQYHGISSVNPKRIQIYLKGKANHYP